VILADVRDREGCDTAASLGERASFRHLDVTDEAQWDAAVGAVLERHGRLDVLVNNAGVLHMGTIEHTPLEQFRRLFEVNTIGAYAGIRAAAPAMRAAGGGAIVNVASIDALVGLNGLTAYTASKWGMRGMAKAAAIELGRDGIRVNTACPAGGNPMMFAPWGEQLSAFPGDIAHYTGARAIPREARVDEVADVVVFLASDLSRFLTGADVPVDGGQTAGHFIPGFNTL
jgi:3alpha(or 20beta)-hydroxysteroid dehydrogenase